MSASYRTAFWKHVGISICFAVFKRLKEVLKGLTSVKTLKPNVDGAVEMMSWNWQYQSFLSFHKIGWCVKNENSSSHTGFLSLDRVPFIENADDWIVAGKKNELVELWPTLRLMKQSMIECWNLSVKDTKWYI